MMKGTWLPSGLMALGGEMQTKVGSFNTGTTSVGTTVSISGLGFRPKAVILWWSGKTGTTPAYSRDHIWSGIGMFTSTSERFCIGGQAQNNVGTSVVDRAWRNDACIVTISSAGSTDGRMDVQSIDADGFTLVVDDAMPRNLRVHYLAIGGGAVKYANCGVASVAFSNTNQDFSVGFQPDFGFFVAGANNATTGSAINHAASVGSWDGSSQQSVYYVIADGQAVTNDGGAANNSYPIWFGFSGGGATVSALSDGFRFNCQDLNQARYVYWLALQGGKYKVGNFNTRTNTQPISVSTGFKPKAMLFTSRCFDETVTLSNLGQGARFSMGAATDPDARVAAAWQGTYNVGTTYNTTGFSESSVFLKVVPSNPNPGGVMDLQSIDANGFTCVMSTPDSNTSLIQYVAFG